MSKNTPAPAPQNSGEREMTLVDYMPLVYLLGTPILLGGVYFIMVKPILERLGLKDSAEDKELQKVADDVKSQNYWSPTYYKLYGGDTISNSYADMYAERLEEAVDGWGTDESAIAGVFNALGSKGNVSLVAERYNMLFNDDLLGDLEGDLSDEDFATYVGNPISKYPS